MLRPVHVQAWWVVYSQRVRKVWSSQIPVVLEEGRNKRSSSWGLVLLLLILVTALLVSTWIHIRGIVTVISVHPAWRCTSPRGVVPFGLGDGAGDCHDVANLPKECLFFPFVFLWEKNFTLFLKVWFLIFEHCWVCYLLSGSPHHAAVVHIRWIPLSGHFWRKAGKPAVRPCFPPFLDVFSGKQKIFLFFFGRVLVWMLHIGRARHPCPGQRFFYPWSAVG